MLAALPEDMPTTATTSGDVEVQGPPIWVSTKGATTIDGSVMPVETTVRSSSVVAQTAVSSDSALPATRPRTSAGSFSRGATSSTASSVSGIVASASRSSSTAPPSTSAPVSSATSGALRAAPGIILTVLTAAFFI
ncbi:hypothetical protein CC85DRAFT_87153 [Cutaneotrichosporon oleaginosum]|uniref:Uncharacterized protein n=1 Tax=Cutaneotrichosporon oleaginosum TaxID=879819 RepID=A0A0J0XXT9_9TREE|nr:uncharacterized protein CC85DRAFT_87153 [Cutaneotrichosporon oleaginosum]KLT45863.1 hypothetical protein CC85DRAFT_87153 [Cutaneotrichosporon oleaginosum]TXT06565.1 hypothetical protein COLE_05896 [Cutaneotrichosporon oleaginosum]